MDFIGRMTRRGRLVLAIAAAVVAGLAGCGGGGEDDGAPVATWTAGLSDLTEDVSYSGLRTDTTPVRDTTTRQVVHLSAGGQALRIKFSNLFGTSALDLTRVRVATSAGDGAIVTSSDTAVTFSGAASVSIAPGQEVWSDRVAMEVAFGSDIAISAYVRDTAPMNTAHRLAGASRYEAAGDATGAASMAAASINAGSAFWVREVDVYRQGRTNVLVTFGDSITEGSGSTSDANRRYPDALSQRFHQAGGDPAVSVVNMGIGGNRWMHDGFGLRGVERFRRDVLTVTGVTHALVLLGVNDIGFQFSFQPAQTVTAEQLITAMSGAAAAGRAAGVKVYFGTLTPFKGAFYYNAQAEDIRQAVNGWIRTNTVAAGFVDFDKAVQDAEDPLRFRNGLSRDGLHPNDAGYQAMADAVDLAVLR